MANLHKVWNDALNQMEIPFLKDKNEKNDASKSLNHSGRKFHVKTGDGLLDLSIRHPHPPVKDKRVLDDTYEEMQLKKLKDNLKLNNEQRAELAHSFLSRDEYVTNTLAWTSRTSFFDVPVRRLSSVTNNSLPVFTNTNDNNQPKLYESDVKIKLEELQRKISVTLSDENEVYPTLTRLKSKLSAKPIDLQVSAKVIEHHVSAKPIDFQISAKPLDCQLSSKPTDRQLSAKPVDRQLSAVSFLNSETEESAKMEDPDILTRAKSKLSVKPLDRPISVASTVNSEVEDRDPNSRPPSAYIMKRRASNFIDADAASEYLNKIDDSIAPEIPVVDNPLSNALVGAPFDIFSNNLTSYGDNKKDFNLPPTSETKRKWRFPSEIFRATRKVPINPTLNSSRHIDTLFKDASILNRFKEFSKNIPDDVEYAVAPVIEKSVKVPTIAKIEENIFFPAIPKSINTRSKRLQMPVDDSRILKIMNSDINYEVKAPNCEPLLCGTSYSAPTTSRALYPSTTIVSTTPGPGYYDANKSSLSTTKSFTIGEIKRLEIDPTENLKEKEGGPGLYDPKQSDFAPAISFGRSRRFEDRNDENPAPGQYFVVPPKLDLRGILPFAGVETIPRESIRETDIRNVGPGTYDPPNVNVLSSYSTSPAVRFPLDERFYVKFDVNNNENGVKSARNRQLEFQETVKFQDQNWKINKLKELASKRKLKEKDAALQRRLKFLRNEQHYLEVRKQYDFQVMRESQRRHDPVERAAETWLIFNAFACRFQHLAQFLEAQRENARNKLKLDAIEREKQMSILNFLGTRITKIQKLAIFVIWNWYYRWKTKRRNRAILKVKLFLNYGKHFRLLFKYSNRIKENAAIRLQKKFRNIRAVRSSRLHCFFEQLLLAETYVIYFFKQYLMFTKEAKESAEPPFELPGTNLPLMLPPVDMTACKFINRLYSEIKQYYSCFSKIYNISSEHQHQTYSVSRILKGIDLNNYIRVEDKNCSDKLSSLKSTSGDSPISFLNSDDTFEDNAPPSSVLVGFDFLKNGIFVRIPAEIREDILAKENEKRYLSFRELDSIWSRKQAHKKLSSLLDSEEAKLIYLSDKAKSRGAPVKRNYNSSAVGVFTEKNVGLIRKGSSIISNAPSTLNIDTKPHFNLDISWSDLISILQTAYDRLNASKELKELKLILNKIFLWMRNHMTHTPKAGPASLLSDFLVYLSSSHTVPSKFHPKKAKLPNLQLALPEKITLASTSNVSPRTSVSRRRSLVVPEDTNISNNSGNTPTPRQSMSRRFSIVTGNEKVVSPTSGDNLISGFPSSFNSADIGGSATKFRALSPKPPESAATLSPRPSITNGGKSSLLLSENYFNSNSLTTSRSSAPPQIIENEISAALLRPSLEDRRKSLRKN